MTQALYKCSTCKIEKPESDFHKDTSKTKGHGTTCKACKCLYTKEHRIFKIMNKLKLDQLLINMPSIHKKIYNAVPTESAWAMADINRELKRIHGTSPDFRQVQSALNTMSQSGLITETQTGRFVKVKIKEKEKDNLLFQLISAPDLIKQEEEKHIKNIDTKSSSTDPFSALIKVSTDINAVVDILKSINKKIEDAALDFTQLLNESEKKSEKLKQLHELLKGISG